MTKRIKLFSIIAFAIFGMATTSVAQDIIIKKSGKKIWAKIIEINNKQIKYYEYTDQGGLVFTMDRAVIREIEFESGADYEEEVPGADPSYYVDDKQWAAKVNFFGFATNTLQLGLEKSLTPGSSIEGSIKLFGIGINESTNWAGGFGFKVGYKVTTGGLFKGDSYRPKHLLHGGYMRPSIGLNYRNYDYFIWDGVQNIKRTNGVTSFHGGIDLGKQWIFNNQLSLDLYTGFHYYGASENEVSGGNFTDQIFSETIDAGDVFGEDNFAFGFGLKIGVLFGAESTPAKKSRRKK